MVRVRTVGMLEHNAKNYPNFKLDVDTIDGSFVGVKDGKIVPVADDTGIYVIISEFTDDRKHRTDAVINAGEYVNLFDVSAWDNQELIVSSVNLASEVTVGNKLVANTEGKLEVGTPTTIGFEVMALAGTSAVVKVVKA